MFNSLHVTEQQAVEALIQDALCADHRLRQAGIDALKAKIRRATNRDVPLRDLRDVARDLRVRNYSRLSKRELLMEIAGAQSRKLKSDSDSYRRPSDGDSKDSGTLRNESKSDNVQERETGDGKRKSA